ncbi:hypothetical protein IJJ08_01145 [bacterium]|nr:hypothetical protein [bacterium]
MTNSQKPLLEPDKNLDQSDNNSSNSGENPLRGDLWREIRAQLLEVDYNMIKKFLQRENM